MIIKSLLEASGKKHIFLMNAFGWSSFLIFPIALFVLFYLNFFPYYVLSILSIIFITKIGQAIGQHRYFSHNAFVVGKFRRFFLCLLATLSTTGTIIHYSAIHRAHHRFSDSGLDPHNPKEKGFWKVWFTLLDEEEIIKRIPKKIVNDLIRDKMVLWFHHYYWYVIISYILLLLLINPIFVVFCYILPVGYARLCMGIQGTFSHNIGYRNFNTDDNSTNSILINIVTLGEGSHNNHHYRQTEYDFGFTGKITELDISAILVRYLIRGKKFEDKYNYDEIKI
jgi:stearoyl-CoA desaturase (delta-9 desaturase)